MTETRDLVAAVQAQHHHWDYAGSLTCACGEKFGQDPDSGWESAVQEWSIHVADAVVAELRPDFDAQVTDSYLLGVGSCIALIEQVGALAAATQTDANVQVAAEWSARVVHAMRSASANIKPGGAA